MGADIGYLQTKIRDLMDEIEKVKDAQSKLERKMTEWNKQMSKASDKEVEIYNKLNDKEDEIYDRVDEWLSNKIKSNIMIDVHKNIQQAINESIDAISKNQSIHNAKERKKLYGFQVETANRIVERLQLFTTEVRNTINQVAGELGSKFRMKINKFPPFFVCDPKDAGNLDMITREAALGATVIMGSKNGDAEK